MPMPTAWVKVLGAERSFFPVTVTKRILKMYVASQDRTMTTTCLVTPWHSAK